MMKNQFRKKIYIVGISLFLISFSRCGISDKSNARSFDADNHPPISINYKDHISFEKSDYPLIDPEEIIIDSLFVQVAYKISSKRVLLIARKLEDDEEGLKLMLIDPSANNKLIYRSSGSYESMTLHPVFFVPTSREYPTIITCNIGTFESWGQRLFMMHGDTINEISYMDIAAKFEADTTKGEENYSLKDIGPFTKVEMTSSGIHLSFDTDSLVYFGEIDGKIDPILDASRIEYSFYDGVLRSKWKSDLAD